MLVLLNKYKGSGEFKKESSFLKKGLCLKTCLRKTVFFSEAQFESFKAEDAKLVSGFDVYKGFAAAEYIVKVLSGLESPVVGETEVLGQFKKQIIPQLKKNSDLEQIIQFILNLVKIIRAKHLIGLGSQSYGSMVRRILKYHQHILFVGSGALTESVLPWVKASKNVMILVRSLERYEKTKVYKENTGLKAFSLDEDFIFDFALHVIVCAPIKAKVLESYLTNANVETIVDLREESKTDPILNLSCKVFDLENVFKGFYTEINKKKKLIKSIEEDIFLKVKERFVKHRPFGWDDLCL